ncbi:MAG: hypothetical protein KF864_02940 [Phycisphaeraceae bacterium]|nr:hypothetical protein [Phycisphaeraceae bacterium]
MPSLAAHAKINLCLSVGGPVPPRNFHPIASLFVCIDLHDTLTIEPLPGGSDSIHEISWAPDAPRPTPIDWPTERDLAVRAHRSLEALARRPLPVRMTLHKRIPVGGGLGGGSADAGAALIAIRDAFSLPFSHHDLRTIGAALGSDVPFFVDDHPGPPRAAVVSGFGEEIKRLNAPLTGDMLLAVPPFGCPTPAVYKAFDADPARLTSAPDRARVVACAEALSRQAAPLHLADLFNDLAAPAETVSPALAQLRAHLSAAYATTFHITGSGSCLFAPISGGMGTPPVHAHALAGVTLMKARLVTAGATLPAA